MQAIFTTLLQFYAIVFVVNFLSLEQPNKLQLFLWPLLGLHLCHLRYVLSSGILVFIQRCALFWMSFGVYITGVLFQTASFVSFFLISHGYCITRHRLSLSERRSIAAVGCVFYFILVGYNACVPYFFVLLLLNYIMVFDVSQNLVVLRYQLSYIEDEDIRAMHDAIYTKYIMSKKFRAAMHIMALAVLAILMNMATSHARIFWLRLLVRELAQIFLYIHIGWMLRAPRLVSGFSLMPSKAETAVLPTYSIEMDAETFKDFTSRVWHIGVLTTPNKEA